MSKNTAVCPSRDQAPRGEGVLALARAVADPARRAHLYVGTSNVLGDWTSLEQAVADDAAFVVRLAQHVIGVDLDHPDALAKLPDLLTTLRERRLVPVVVASGQEDRRHVFIRVHPTQRRVVEQEVVDLLGSRESIRQDIRPPLAAHRLGLPVRLVEPADVHAAVQALRPVVEQQRRLSPRAWGLLRDGDQAGDFTSRSEALMSVVTSMVNAGWSYPHVLTVLLDRDNAVGAKVHEICDKQGRGVAERYVERTYDTAVNWVADHPQCKTPQEFVVALVAHRASVQDWSWPGRSGQTQKVVLTALLDIMIKQSRVEVEPSHRLLAQRTGISRNTVESALTSLTQDGWISCTRRGRGFSNRYRINLNRTGLILEPLPTSPGGGYERSGAELSPNHDAFRHGGGLGKNGYTLLTHLSEPLSAADLTQRTGIPMSTVKRLLVNMVEARLVTKVDAEYQAKSGLLLTVRMGVLARQTGRHLNGVRQRASHQRERDLRTATEQHAADVPSLGLHAALEACVVHGLLNPVTGGFQPLGGPLSVQEDVPCCGEVGPIVITLPVDGHLVSVRDHREVVHAVTVDEASRRYEVFGSSSKSASPDQ